MRYGFKARAERISVEARKALDLGVVDPIVPATYASHIGAHVLTVDELDLSPSARRQLLQTDASSWSGMTIRESGLVAVLVNPTHSPERQASTMMHELSHIVLDHVPIRVDVSNGGILLVSEYSESDEDEANWLSGALLLPRDALLHCRACGWRPEQITAHFGISRQMYDWRVRLTGVDVQIRRSKDTT